MKAYYIFNDLNLGPENIRVQGNKKRYAYDQVEVSRLVFPDKKVTAIEVGKKFLKLFEEAGELEQVLKNKGAKFHELHCQKSTETPEKDSSWIDGTTLIWDFDNGDRLRIVPRSSQEIQYWNWTLGPTGVKHNLYGGFPLLAPIKSKKMYDGDQVPEQEVMRKMKTERPTPNWVVAIIVIAIFFLAAMIYSNNY